MAEDIEHQFWYNQRTGLVEQGFQSPAPDRIGPFATREEAEHAWDTLRENAEKWAAEDAEEDR